VVLRQTMWLGLATGSWVDGETGVLFRDLGFLRLSIAYPTEVLYS